MRDFHHPGRSAVYAVGGICATSHPVAASVGLQMLQRGGNAVDAAIAAAATLTICEPHMCALGGDAFALVKPAGSEAVVGLNGSGRAPAGLDAAGLRARGLGAIPPGGVESVTLPGAVDAFCALSERFGKLGLDAVLAPAIAHADEGVPVAPRVASDWARSADRLQGAARTHYLPGGDAPGVGTRFRAPGLAEVMRRIATRGRDGFYAGPVADDMLASLRVAGGTHTEADLAATRCDWTEPVVSDYRGATLLEHPPNGQGAAAALLLNILSHFDLAALDPLGAERAHLEAEATKLAYDARDRFIADPDHCTRLAHMLAPETAARLAGLIDLRRALPVPVAPATAAIHRDTVLVCAADRDGMAVSLIFSIFHSFGSGLASERYGILFQNRGAGFTLTHGHPNEAAGGKRPLHTIIPAMLAGDGRVSHVFGVMGGAYQCTGHARAVSNLRDYGMDVQAALDAPRSFATDGVLEIEAGYAPAVRDRLAALGHAVVMRPDPLGGGQIIAIDHERGVLIGGSDPRKDGYAAGF